MNPLPTSFQIRLRQQFPEDAEMILEALERQAPTSVQLNPGKPFNLSWKTQDVPWFPGGKILEQRPLFTLDPLFHAGCYYPQENSSMFLWHVVQSLCLEDGVRCLDLCAAPGGKSVLLSSAIGKKGMLISNEIMPLRNNILQENLTKSGRNNFIVTSDDPSRFSTIENYFDLVLVDAPCSGEGMFRKDPASRDEWSMDNVQQCSKRQQKILEDVLPSLKPGGHLIYCTCTFSLEENDENCAWLAAQGQLIKVQFDVPGQWNIRITETPGYTAYRFFPGAVTGEGFFMSVFRKTGERVPSQKYKNKKPFFRKPTKAESLILEKWIDGASMSEVIIRPDGVVIYSSASPEELNTLSKALYFTQVGIEIGELTTRDFIPSHGLAMSGIFSTEVPRVPLNLDQSILFLKKLDPGVTGYKGWVIFTYEGHPLGIGKALQGRVNNYYPKEWRIRMT